MIDPIVYRIAEESDIPQLVNLINSQYSRKKAAEYFRWQYFDSFYPSVVMCAFMEESVIGMFGLQKRKLSDGVNAGQAIDLLVDPAWRGKGVFAELGVHASGSFKDLDLLCVFPNLNGKNACEKSLHWKTIGKIDSLVLPSSDANLHRQNAESISEKHRGAARIHFAYTDQVRHWRFDCNPLYQYVRIPGEEKSFVVTKTFVDPTSGKRYGDIVDFESPSEDKRVLKNLLVSACEYFRTQRVETITTWALPHTMLAEVTKSMGFLALPQERYFCVSVFSQKHEYLYDFSRWHLVQADAEIY